MDEIAFFIAGAATGITILMVLILIDNIREERRARKYKWPYTIPPRRHG